MSALPHYEPREERGAFFRLGQLGSKLEEAEARVRKHNERAETAEKLLEALTESLGVDLDTLERIGQADSAYFKEVRDEILKALKTWDEDTTVPVCLYCGSPRLDWIESEAAWKCRDCGTVGRTADGRRAA